MYYSVLYMLVDRSRYFHPQSLCVVVLVFFCVRLKRLFIRYKDSSLHENYNYLSKFLRDGMVGGTKATGRVNVRDVDIT